MRHVYRLHVLPCAGPRCTPEHGEALKAAFKEVLPDRKDLGVRISSTSCQGLCSRGPNVTIHPEGIFYHRVELGDVRRIVDEHLRGGHPVEELIEDPLLQPDSESDTN